MTSRVVLNRDRINEIREDMLTMDNRFQEIVKILKRSAEKWLDVPIKGWFLTRPRYDRVDTLYLYHERVFLSSIHMDKDLRKTLEEIWFIERNNGNMLNLLKDYDKGNGVPIAYSEDGIISGVWLSEDSYQWVRRSYLLMPKVTEEFVVQMHEYFTNFDYVNSKPGL